MKYILPVLLAGLASAAPIPQAPYGIPSTNSLLPTSSDLSAMGLLPNADLLPSTKDATALTNTLLTPGATPLDVVKSLAPTATQAAGEALNTVKQVQGNALNLANTAMNGVANTAQTATSTLENLLNTAKTTTGGANALPAEWLNMIKGLSSNTGSGLGLGGLGGLGGVAKPLGAR